MIYSVYIILSLNFIHISYILKDIPPELVIVLRPNGNHHATTRIFLDWAVIPHRTWFQVFRIRKTNKLQRSPVEGHNLLRLNIPVSLYSPTEELFHTRWHLELPHISYLTALGFRCTIHAHQ